MNGLVEKRTRQGGREGGVEGERERETIVDCILFGSEDRMKVRKVG